MNQLKEVFRTHFGRPPTRGARAPGRVNLIGEHTDYNQGWVLPCAIDRATLALAAPRPDRQIRVWARDLDQEACLAPRAPAEAAAAAGQGGWAHTVQGVLSALEESGVEIGGLDLMVSSRVPRDSGLSSSAALCVSVAGVVSLAAGLPPDPAAWALAAHRGESHYAGVGCGILDHFASAHGRADSALRIDCRSQAIKTVPIPPGKIALLIAHSGVMRSLAGGRYAERVAECRAALDAANAGASAGSEVSALRDFGVDDLPRLCERLAPRLLRRARHVITENARVHAFCAALRAEDLSRLGALLAEGQRSLCDDYEVSTPELDFLCREASRLPGVIGSRLTGAGFGGCTLHLVAPEAASEVARHLARRFEKQFGHRPSIFQSRASDGAGPIPMT